MPHPHRLRHGRPRTIGRQRGRVRRLTVRPCAGVPRPRIIAARSTTATARSGRVKGHNGAVSAAGRHSTRQGHHAGEKAAVGVRVLTEDRGRGLRGERIVQVAEKKEEEKLADKIIMNQLQ